MKLDYQLPVVPAKTAGFQFIRKLLDRNLTVLFITIANCYSIQYMTLVTHVEDRNSFVMTSACFCFKLMPKTRLNFKASDPHEHKQQLFP